VSGVQISTTNASAAIAAPATQLGSCEASTSCSRLPNGHSLGDSHGHAHADLGVSADAALHGTRGRSLAELAASGAEAGLSRESAAVWRPSCLGRAMGGSYSCDGVARACLGSTSVIMSSHPAASVKERRQKVPPRAAAPAPLNTSNQWAALGGSDDNEDSDSESWSSILDDPN